MRFLNLFAKSTLLFSVLVLMNPQVSISEEVVLAPQASEEVKQLTSYDFDFKNATILVAVKWMKTGDAEAHEKTLVFPVRIWLRDRTQGEKLPAFIQRWVEENPRRAYRRFSR